jgi:ribosomal protein S11
MTAQLEGRTTTIRLKKNNMFINLIRENGETIKKFSAGTEKYKGAKKKTAIAKFDIATNIGIKLLALGYQNFSLRFTGNYRHRKSVIKGFKNAGIKFMGHMVDTRLGAHNGCKQRKERRKKKRG